MNEAGEFGRVADSICELVPRIFTGLAQFFCERIPHSLSGGAL